jgi:hypothetical protein
MMLVNVNKALLKNIKDLSNVLNVSNIKETVFKFALKIHL